MTEAQALELGRMVKRARRSRGLTLRELDGLTGVSYTWLSRLEGGLIPAPAPSKLSKVVDALGISPGWIDRLTQGKVSGDLPSIHTYFRTKYNLNPEEIRQIEDLFDQIRRNRREHPEGGELPD
jgi:transcriptional regulator with XRE-family HTH domain